MPARRRLRLRLVRRRWAASLGFGVVELRMGHQRATAGVGGTRIGNLHRGHVPLCLTGHLRHVYGKTMGYVVIFGTLKIP